MKLIFYFFSIYPLKIGFFLCNLLFKLIPNFLLKTLAPFKTTKKNIEIAFPDLTEIETFNLSKESYKETIKSFYETLFVWSRNEAKIIEETKRINNRFLFSSAENSNGLIVFAVHNRSIDFLLRWMSSQRQHTSLYKVIKFKKINKFVKNFREEGGNTMVETRIGGVKSIMSALKNNQMTCMASDQVPADGLGKYSTFFGHECFSFSLAPSLARKTNKPILMAHLTYNEGLGHVMSFKKPNKKIYDENGVDIMNNEMETEIRKSPKEYSWEYKKFRKLPDGPKDLYKG
tara:strand:- start:3249 stop:4112 length:864 start_codon:yes stop_codon:yes gene_type:complete